MHSTKKTYISNKLFLIFLLIVTGVLGSLQYVQWRKRVAIGKEVASLTEEARQLEARNKEISESLEFLHTQSAKERIAREQLGLKKEGEIVVSFQEQVNALASTPASEHVPNRVKWWNYFFNEH